MRSKRRRCDSLEHGFADLSLERTEPIYPSHTTLFANIPEQAQAPSHQRTAHTQSVVLSSPPSVIPMSELLAPEPIRDVKMTVSTWYEPEKDRA